MALDVHRKVIRKTIIVDITQERLQPGQEGIPCCTYPRTSDGMAL
jgi:hypothetical protein